MRKYYFRVVLIIFLIKLFINVQAEEIEECTINYKEGDDSIARAPWSVLIHHKNMKADFKVWFPGIILSRTVILTEGSYFGSVKDDIIDQIMIDPFDNYIVNVGNSNLSYVLNNLNNSSSNYNISYIRLHPKYKQNKLWYKRNNHNFALIILKEPIQQFNSKVNKICLPNINLDFLSIFDNFVQENNIVEINGWNKYRNHQMQSYNVQIQSEEYCLNLWNEYDKRDGYNESYNYRVCANGMEGDNTQLCNHKSTGIVSKRENKFYLEGVVDNYYSDFQKCDNPDAKFFLFPFDRETLHFVESALKCNNDEFTCNNGQCINLNKLCNKRPECQDGSDEDPIYCRGINYCNSSQFACGVYGKCIDSSLVCDGKSQCENNEDEKNCPINKHKLTASEIAGISASIIFLFIVSTILFIKFKLLQRKLTDKETEDFFQGDKKFNPGSPEAASFPDNKNIPVNDIVYDLNQSLGNGKFGIVFKGLYKNETKVAVKTFKKQGDIKLFKEFMREVKVMCFVGEHENIVNLVGAITNNLKNRSLIIVLEYCENGSLKDFLLSKNLFLNDKSLSATSNNGYNSRPLAGYINARNSDENIQIAIEAARVINYTVKDMVIWSHEIASGMAYLASKKLVHGDLACRNVLIDANLKAKVSDFGFAIKLNEDQIFSNKQCDYVAWKWMAPEILTQEKYSESSDIWSYGICLYEIFSRGQDPYLNIDQFSENFSKNLSNGTLLLGKPNHASEEVYKIMKDCWKGNPEERLLTFDNIVEIFRELLE